MMPSGIKFVFPLVKDGKENAELSRPLGIELEEHLKKYDKIILIAFGTSFLPKNETLRSIFTYAVQNNKYGFVITVSNA
jgi:hypothetical protein